MAGYVYDPRSSRYRAPDGRYVSQKQLHGGVVKMASASGDRMAGFATRLQAGQMNLAEWQAAMHAEIRSTHLAASMAAHGGKAMMSPADFGFAGSEIKKQLQYLRAWSADLASGKAPIDGLRLAARARLYATSSVGTFSAVQARDARNSGAEMEERNFSGSKDPCVQCPGLDLLRWVPLGTLPAVGQRACKSGCRCRIERRLVVREEAA